jgi:hypothetical protein
MTLSRSPLIGVERRSTRGIWIDGNDASSSGMVTADAALNGTK